MNPLLAARLPAPVTGGYRDPDWWIWCGSPCRADDGTWHLFASRWPKALGFGWNWLYHSTIVRCTSPTPQGPYRYAETVFARRGPQWFDGMNVHNPAVRRWDGRWWMFYIGSTYGGAPPAAGPAEDPLRNLEVWNRKRIGLAVAERPEGPWRRPDRPLLEPRDCSFWDHTITTNPAPVILPDGTTYLIYKSRAGVGAPLQLGVARASRPDGPYERLGDGPILAFADPDLHVEDPFVWWRDGVFHLIAKDDAKNGSPGITGEWGAGIHATSRDCLHWSLAPEPKAWTRTVAWDDGITTVQAHCERPALVFDDAGRPTHLFQATAAGPRPWDFHDSWNLVIPLDPDLAARV
jgi:hypothetical protein